MGNRANRKYEEDVIYEEEQASETEEAPEQESEADVIESGEAEDESGKEESEAQEAAEPDELKVLEVKLADTTDRMLRIQADYDNFRRRTKQEKESAAKYRSQNLAEKLLPALDNFERAMMITPQEEETKNLLQGMDMVYRQLKDALAEEGIEPIEAVGQPFDPHYHQAVMQVESEEHEPNTVVEEMQKGYQLKDRVIRPAMVKVNA